MQNHTTAVASEDAVATRRPRRQANGSAQLATVRQAAEILGVSEMTIRRAIYDGDMPVLKFRNRYHIPREFLSRLLADANGGEQVEVADRCVAWRAQHLAEEASA